MILKKYKFPLNIFVVFEKINPVIYTSDVLTNNHYVCFINKNWCYPLNVFLKNDLFYNYSFLVEMSCIDTLKYNNILPKKEFYNNKNRFILYNIYYMYFIKLKITFVHLTNNNIISIDNLYKNSNWMEREISEMFGINYLNKNDNRSLLLDYSRNEFPMLKDFPSEGFYEIYFDFFDNKLSYLKNEFVEL